MSGRINLESQCYEIDWKIAAFRPEIPRDNRENARRQGGRDAFIVASATCFPSSGEEFATVREDRVHAGEQEEEGGRGTGSLSHLPPTLAHISPHHCGASPREMPRNAMQRLFSAARCERSPSDASLPEKVGNDGRRKSDIGLRNRAGEVVRTRGNEREREDNNGHHGRADAAG